MTRGEEWRPIPEFAGLYEASSLGRIRSTDRAVRHGESSVFRRGVEIKQQTTPKGYKQVRLHSGGVGYTRSVHKLVSSAFHGEGGGLEACHYNGVRSDNRAENLRWDTRGNNQRDSVRHGTHNQARKTHCPSGHEYTPDNTWVAGRGERQCRICRFRWNSKRVAVARDSRLTGSEKSVYDGVTKELEAQK